MQKSRNELCSFQRSVRGVGSVRQAEVHQQRKLHRPHSEVVTGEVKNSPGLKRPHLVLFQSKLQETKQLSQLFFQISPGFGTIVSNPGLLD